MFDACLGVPLEGHLTMLPSSCWSKHRLGEGAATKDHGTVLFAFLVPALGELPPEITISIPVNHGSWIMDHGPREAVAAQGGRPFPGESGKNTSPASCAPATRPCLPCLGDLPSPSSPLMDTMELAYKTGMSSESRHPPILVRPFWLLPLDPDLR